MPVRINTIHLPAEEMRMLGDGIKSERRIRASERLKLSQEYVDSQVAYVDLQIEVLLKRRQRILDNQANAPMAIAASLEREKRMRSRHAELKNRHKIERLAKLRAEAKKMAEEFGLE